MRACEFVSEGAAYDPNITSTQPPNSAPSPVGLYYRGFPCTKDCQGHIAGYNWAQDRNLINIQDVVTNSNSFLEGCQSYLNGD